MAQCSSDGSTVTATLDWYTYLAVTMHFLQRRHTSSALLLLWPHARKMEIARSYMQQQHSAFVNISRAWGDRVVVVITSDLGKLLAWLPETEAWVQLLYRCCSIAARCLCCIALCCGCRNFSLETPPVA